MSSVRQAIQAFFKTEGLPRPDFNQPPKSLGFDFSSPVAFLIAKNRTQSADQIAKNLAEQLGKQFQNLLTVSASGGFVNFSYNFSELAKTLDQKTPIKRKTAKVMIEHTSINPNKAAHIGHLRNAVIGDTVARILKKTGHRVEIVNYIDDSGLQVAEQVTGMLYLEEPRYDEKRANIDEIWEKAPKDQPFDHYSWQLYSKAHQAINSKPELKERARAVLHQIESGQGPIADFAKELSRKIVSAHLKTMARLNIGYDLLNWESDILQSGFWLETFELLKKRRAIKKQDDRNDPNAGAWIVELGGVSKDSSGNQRSADKILVRSDGSLTYTAKDISYQLWKFGIIKSDFHYERWPEPVVYTTSTNVRDPESIVYTTSKDARDNESIVYTTSKNGVLRPDFGKAEKVVNVIDRRQSYPQEAIIEVMKKAGFAKEARNSYHLAYEVVNLSEKSVDAKRPSDLSKAGQTISSRKGIGVMADFLYDKVFELISVRTNDQRAASALAAAAIRYYLLKPALQTIVVFDFDQALQTNGDTGVYLVYTSSRAKQILKKAEPIENVVYTTADKLTDDEKNLLKTLDEWPVVLNQAADELRPSIIAEYAFRLAQTFTSFYEARSTGKIIELEEPKRSQRLKLVKLFTTIFDQALDALGIEAPDRI